MTGKIMLTRSHADIVQGKLGHPGVELEQQGQRLANATSSTEDGHLGQLQREDGKCQFGLLNDTQGTELQRIGIPDGPTPRRRGAGT